MMNLLFKNIFISKKYINRNGFFYKLCLLGLEDIYYLGLINIKSLFNRFFTFITNF